MGLPMKGETALVSPYKSGNDALRFGFGVSLAQVAALLVGEQDRREVTVASTRLQWATNRLFESDDMDIITGEPKNE